MTLKELFKKESIWHKKITFLETYHLMRTLKNPLWTQADTAKTFEISIGLVSEDLKLAKKIRENGELKKLSRNTALKRIRTK